MFLSLRSGLSVISRGVIAGAQQSYNRILKLFPTVSSQAPASTRPVQQGQVCEFDGVDDYIDTGITTSSDTYIEATIKKSSVVNTRFIFGCNNSAGTERIYVDDRTGKFRFVIGANSDRIEVSATTGVWYVLRMYTNGDVYIDGALVGNTGGTMDATETIFLGARNNGGNDATWWSGTMSTAKIYSNGVLTQYNLNHASGTTAYDSSGNGNHGTLQNGAAFVVDNTLPPEADKLNLEGYSQRRNAYTFPDQFFSSARVTKTLNAAVAPDGNITATEYQINATGSKYIYKNISRTIGAYYTFSFYVKFPDNTGSVYFNDFDGSKKSKSLNHDGTLSGTDYADRWFNSAVTDLGGGWYRFSSTYRHTLTSGNLGVSFSGTVGNSFYIWGHQLEVGSDLTDLQKIETDYDSYTPPDDASNILIPRDESDPTNDIFGNPLQYSGSVYPRRPEYRNSYAASFDGSNDVIESSITSWTTSQASVACWIKTTNTGNEAIATQWLSNSGWWVRIKAGKIEIYTSAGLRFASADTYNTGEWIHVAISYGLSTANNKLWINGALEEEIGTSAGWSTATTPILVGGLSSSGYNYNGEISNIIIDNQIWSDADALALYNGTYTGALIHHPLTEGAGDTVYDISGNGNHGTINNASTGTEGAGFWAGRIDGEANAMNNNNGFSKRMLFDGGQYVTTDSSLSLSGNFSISFTAICKDISARRGVIGYNSNNFIRFNTATQIQFRVDGSNYYYSIPDCTITHSYKLERTGTDVELFVDGVSAGSNTISSNITIDRIGAIYGGVEPHNGLIYDINLNNQTSYNGYGNTNADWVDTSGNGNDGTVNGSPALLRIPADASDPTKDALGDTLTNPAITDGYNGAETELDAYNIAEGDNPSPATSGHSALDAIESGTEFTSDDSVYNRITSAAEDDRLITFTEDLTGDDKTLAEKYTQNP